MKKNPLHRIGMMTTKKYLMIQRNHQMNHQRLFDFDRNNYVLLISGYLKLKAALLLAL